MNAPGTPDPYYMLCMTPADRKMAMAERLGARRCGKCEPCPLGFRGSPPLANSISVRGKFAEKPSLRTKFCWRFFFCWAATPPVVALCPAVGCVRKRSAHVDWRGREVGLAACLRWELLPGTNSEAIPVARLWKWPCWDFRCRAGFWLPALFLTGAIRNALRLHLFGHQRLLTSAFLLVLGGRGKWLRWFLPSRAPARVGTHDVLAADE